MTKMFVRHIVLVLVTGIAFPLPSYPQAPGISISAGTQISSDSPKTPFAETFLAINPRNTRNLITASMVVADGTVLSWVYASRDGGGTWQRARTTTENNSMFRASGWDPAVYFDTGGTAFLVMISAPGHLLLSRSNDGGFTWGSPVTLCGGMHDRPYLAFDNSGGKFNGRMYVVASTLITEVSSGRTFNALELFSSSDKGQSFLLAQVLASVEGHEEVTIMPSDVLVTSEGKVVIPYWTYPVSEGGTAFPPGHWWTTVSEDGGLTFLLAEKGPTRSRAQTWFRMIRSDALPRAAIDLSKSLFRDRIYLTWPDFDGRNYVVKVSYSRDLGRTWSTPIVVNDKTGSEPSNPAIAVNKDGIVALAFNDRRDDPKASCYSLYYSVSLDGAETFLPNIKATEAPTCPLAQGNWQPFAVSSFDVGQSRPGIWIRAAAERFVNGGETQGFVAGDQGVFHSAWINGQSGVMQLWLGKMRVNTGGVQSPFSNPRQDVSHDLALELSEPTVDFSAHTVSVKVRLINHLPITIPGPFTVVLDDMQWSALKDLHVLNSDNGLSARGAVWNMRVAGKNLLHPQEKSEERIFQWGFTGGFPEELSEPLFSGHFLILGQPQTRSSSSSPTNPY